MGYVNTEVNGNPLGHNHFQSDNKLNTDTLIKVNQTNGSINGGSGGPILCVRMGRGGGGGGGQEGQV